VRRDLMKSYTSAPQRRQQRHSANSMAWFERLDSFMVMRADALSLIPMQASYKLASVDHSSSSEVFGALGTLPTSNIRRRNRPRRYA